MEGAEMNALRYGDPMFTLYKFNADYFSIFNLYFWSKKWKQRKIAKNWRMPLKSIFRKYSLSHFLTFTQYLSLTQSYFRPRLWMTSSYPPHFRNQLGLFSTTESFSLLILSLSLFLLYSHLGDHSNTMDTTHISISLFSYRSGFLSASLSICLSFYISFYLCINLNKKCLLSPFMTNSVYLPLSTYLSQSLSPTVC